MLFRVWRPKRAVAVPPKAATPTKVLVGIEARRENTMLLLLALIYGQHGDVIACNFELYYITYGKLKEEGDGRVISPSNNGVGKEKPAICNIFCHVEIASVIGSRGVES